MNPEEFSDALDEALPPKPATKGWGAKARRRSRNRRAVGVTGVVGAVAVAVLAVTVQLTGQPTLTATPMPADPSTQEPAVASLEPAACDGPLEGEHDVAELPDGGRMPDGAETVWLCGGEGRWGAELVGAAEPLTQNVEGAVAAFNAEPTSFSAIDCDATIGERSSVVYTYPDGSRYRAEVWRGQGSGSCNAVKVGDRLRFEPQPYMNELAALWSAQRAEVGAAFVPGDVVCPDKASVLDISPKEGVTGYVCGALDDGSGQTVQIPLPDDLVSDIVAEITLRDGGVEPGLDRSAPSLVLLNEHGDPFTIFGDPDSGYHWYPPRNEVGMQQWVPSPEVAARMWAEIGASGQCTVPGRITPDQVSVYVYDGGGGPGAVAAMVAHLEGAGFPVTDTGESVAPSLGGPVYLRIGGDNRGAGLVDSWVAGGSAELGRDDQIVDVIVTDEFTVDALREGKRDIGDGNFVCAGQEPTPPSESTSAPEPVTTDDAVDQTVLDWHELELVVQAMAGGLVNYDELDQLSATLSHTDYATARDLAPGFLGGSGPDDMPVLILRLEGPMHPLPTGADDPGNTDSPLPKTGAFIVLDPAGKMSFTIFLFDDSGDPALPAIDPAETRVQELDLVGGVVSRVRTSHECGLAREQFIQVGSVAMTPPAEGLPEDPVAVWTCLSGLVDAKSRPPMNAGENEFLGDDARAAVGVYNDLPMAAAGCPTSEGRWGYVVYHYGLGRQFLVQVRDDRCGSVIAGEDHRQGRDEFLAVLGDLADG